jgi:V8-like Glu-specific endopeptidase
LIDEVERLSSDAPRPLNPGIVGTVAAEANLERVWGLNTLKSLSWLRQALIAAKAVCRIETRTSYGTGFLVKADWVVTNHHVLANSSEVAEATLAFGFEEADDGSLGKPITYRLDPSTYIGDPDLDCAVARVAGRTDSLEMERTWGELKIDATTKLQTGQHVVIIQHPQGGPKRICMTDNQIVNVYGYRLQYMTDTMPGSSGSPVFSDDWSVVAVHHAGGNLQKNQKGEKLFANEGILFSAIAEHPSFRVVFETIE